MTSFVQSILLHFRFTGAYLNTMEGPDTIHGQLQVCITQYMIKKSTIHEQIAVVIRRSHNIKTLITNVERNVSSYR